MNMWHQAFDAANEVESQLGEDATPDQKIALAQVYATLSVSQELSRMIMDERLTVRLEDASDSPVIKNN
jgi:hypothetical protein